MTATMIFLVLLLGVMGTTWQASIATGERDRAIEAEGLAEQRRARALTAERTAKDEADRANMSADRERQLAEDEWTARRESQQHLYDARMNLVQLASDGGRRARVLELLDQCRPDDSLGDDEYRSFEWYYWWRQCHRYAWSFPCEGKQTTRDYDLVAVSPNGEIAVIARQVWNLAAGERLGTLYYPEEEKWLAEYAAVEEAAHHKPDDTEAAKARDAMLVRHYQWSTDTILFSPDGTMVAAKKHGTDDTSTIHLFDVATLKPVRTITFGGGDSGFIHNHAMAFSPDSSLITAVPYRISKDRPQEICVWAVATGEIRLSVRPSGDRLPGDKNRRGINYTRTLAFSPDGTLLATAGYDENGASRTQLWDLKTGECVTTLWARDGHTVSMRLCFSADGARLLAQSYDGQITVWDLATEKIDLAAPTPIRGCISPDGRVALATKDYGAMEIRDVATGESRGILLGHDSDYFEWGLSHDGSWLVSAGDGAVRVWDLRTDRVFKDHASITDASTQFGYSLFDFSPDGKTLACVHDRGTVDLWDVATERRVRMLPFDFAGPVHSVAYSPDGRTIAAAGVDRDTRKFRIDLLDLEAGMTRHLGEHAADICSLKFSANGACLASADVDDGIRVWGLASGGATLVDLNGQPEREPGEKKLEGVFTPDGYTQSNGCVAWSPDSRMVAYTVRTQKEGIHLALADPATGEVVKRLDGLKGRPVTFSPDGSLLAVAAGMEIQLLDCDTWEVKRTLSGHMRTINGLAFSSDGKRLASASQDQTILWNTATGAPVLTFPSPRTRRYSSVAFSPDGTQLAIGGSTGRDGSIHIYRTATEQEVVAGRSDRNVAPEMALAKAREDRGRQWGRHRTGRPGHLNAAASLGRVRGRRRL